MADKTYISTVKLPNDNTTYYIKDSEAVKGSGTSGNLAVWNGTSTVTDGPAIISGGTGFLKQDGTWATPTDTNTWRPLKTLNNNNIENTLRSNKTARFKGSGSVDVLYGYVESNDYDDITIYGTNNWRPIKVSGTTFKNGLTTSGNINYVAGSNITLGTSGDDLTISSTDTNTWRGIYVEDTEWKNNTSSDNGYINIKGGSNVTVTGQTDGRNLTIAATDTNRGIQVNGTTFLNTATGNPVNFAAGSNVTITATEAIFGQPDTITINAQLPGGGMQFQGVVNATGTSTAEQIIKAKTNQNKGSVWLADDTGLEWIATEDVGGTAFASSWEAMGGRYGNMAYCDTGTATYQPAGTVTVTPTTATGRVFAPSYQGNQAVVTLPSHAADSFTQGSFTQGTFSAGTLPSCTLPVLTTGVSNEVLTIGWSAGTFSAGTLPSHAADSFTKPTFTQGTFSAGTTAPLTSVGSIVTGISSATFTGTTATITVTPYNPAYVNGPEIGGITGGNSTTPYVPSE